MKARMDSTASTASTSEAVALYLRTGDSDGMFEAWPGSVMERCQAGNAELRQALIREVHRRAPSPKAHDAVRTLDVRKLAASKSERMVRGLFPQKEQDRVLALLQNCVVFLTPESIEGALLGQPWLGTAWALANLYLASVGADLLGKDAPLIVGLSSETTCYVSMAYFDEADPFADFVVHEIAHVFHNCKRHLAGLPNVGEMEWLLDIEFSKRETFAYSCEAYFRILERSDSPAARRDLAGEFVAGYSATESEREVADIVRAAAAARNGWKTIRERCAPSR